MSTISDLSDVVELLASGSYNVIRRGQTVYSGGRRQSPTETTIEIIASIQPASGQVVERLPEGRRDRETMVVFTPTELKMATGDQECDLLQIDGAVFETELCKRWNVLANYFEAVVTRRPPTAITPPTILTLAFSGGYPGSQTELKAGDTFTVIGTTDKVCVGLQFSNFEAGAASTVTFAATTSFTATLTVADRGNVLQALHGRARAVDANGNYGATHDTSNTVNCNNLHPTLTFGAITYPATQSALKNSETATVAVTTANLDSILFDSPNSQLSVTAPTTIGTPKTVTRIAGSYNVATNNFRGVATRAANAATTTTQGVVAIANVAPVLTATLPAARLRSGGNNGTAVQNHTITLTSDQQLQAAPSMSAGASGTFTGSWSGGPLIYTRVLQVADDDAKGTFTWTSVLGTGLSGLTVAAVVNTTYVLGGFVSRNLTFSSFSQTTTLGVAVVDYSKLSATIFTATNQPALKNASQGDHSDIANTYTVDAMDTNPTTVYWNDASAASTNSSGTAQITGLQEAA